MTTQTRRCTACGAEVESKRSTKDMAGKHAGCGGQLMKASLYEANKSMEKVYSDE